MIRILFHFKLLASSKSKSIQPACFPLREVTQYWAPLIIVCWCPPKARKWTIWHSTNTSNLQNGVRQLDVNYFMQTKSNLITGMVDWCMYLNFSNRPESRNLLLLSLKQDLQLTVPSTARLEIAPKSGSGLEFRNDGRARVSPVRKHSSRSMSQLL